MEREPRIYSKVDFFRKRAGKIAHLSRQLPDLHHMNACARELAPVGIRASIENRLGFFPPYFAPALEFPVLLKNLWTQHCVSYYDNPLPGFFKEALLLRLARCCASPYFVLVHACRLYETGVSAREILRIMEKPVPTANDVDAACGMVAAMPRPVVAWPDDDKDGQEAKLSAFSDCLLTFGMAVFMGVPEAGRCLAELKSLLGDACGALMLLLSYAKAAHFWMETHPEIRYETHPLVRRNSLCLTQEEPALVDILQNYQTDPPTGGDGEKLVVAPAPGSESSPELLENSNDIMFSYNFSGKLLAVNQALERIVGYAKEEALHLTIMDISAPECMATASNMLDPDIVGEAPFNCELDIIAKEGNRITLNINTRPMFYGGQPIAVQATAYDITRQKQVEDSLRKANSALTAQIEELQEQSRELELLNEMGGVLRACSSIEEAYRVIPRFAEQLFPSRVGVLYRLHATHQGVAEAVLRWGDQELAYRSFSRNDCWALRRGREHRVENSSTGLVCKHVHHDIPNGYMCVPLVAQSETIGVMHLIHPDNVVMTENRCRLAINMAEQIAMTLANLRLHKTLRTQAIRDPLTGLFNRRFMEESLDMEIRRAERNRRSLGMIMIDLDHFKYFNDTFGHEAGDLLLKQLGMLLRTNIRGEDIACRYGGEEFTLILPEGNIWVTRRRADFYKEAIQSLDVNYKGTSLGRITASMGVAVFPDHGLTARALIEAADHAMYRSKMSGRDCVTMAG